MPGYKNIKIAPCMHIAVASDVCAKNLDNVCMDDSLITV